MGSVLPGNLPVRSRADSPTSGTYPAMYTSALTLVWPLAAALMTEPP